ncbi:MAG: hypothetical protein GQ552_06890 [Flavobacteriaceae bacterium]|nr:hypothetical protein [Flavobacteriaceae bacterium]
MKKTLLSTLALFLYVSITIAQTNLNAYKYIIIPKKYDFLKEDNKYKLNDLTKFLFEKQGFETLVEGENYPSDLMSNLCLALTANIKDDSSLFTSKLAVELSNCYKKVVFTSVQGKSKEKDYERSYQEALRNSFVTFEELQYSFDENLVVNKQVVEEALPQVSNTTPITPAVVVIPVTPVVKEVIDPVPPVVEEEKSVAKSYKNDNISFILIEQNDGLVAYVKSSNNTAYQMGEKIGTLLKTSRPNTYRITWKDKGGKTHETTGYFDDKGDLKIDIEKDGNIQVVTFTLEN